MTRVVLITQQPGDAPDIVTDGEGVEFFSYCPWAKGDELYRLSVSVKVVPAAELDALLSAHRIGQIGDMPGKENAVADLLGIERPHDLPSGLRLAVDNTDDGGAE